MASSSLSLRAATGIAAVVCLLTIFKAFAAPPGSVYTLGETLAPTCAPGDANCTVIAPMATVTPGTSGNVLTSNGTIWTSAAPAAGSNGIIAAATVDGSAASATNTKNITSVVRNDINDYTVTVTSNTATKYVPFVTQISPAIATNIGVTPLTSTTFRVSALGGTGGDFDFDFSFVLISAD